MSLQSTSTFCIYFLKDEEEKVWQEFKFKGIFSTSFIFYTCFFTFYLIFHSFFSSLLSLNILSFSYLFFPFYAGSVLHLFVLNYSSMSSSQVFHLSSPIVLFNPFFVLFFLYLSSYPTQCCPFTFSSLSSIFSLSSLDFSAFPDHRLSITRE